MDQDSNVHRDEQYPLLKVETIDGGGDIKLKQQAPNVVPTGWTVTHTPKQSWLDRWPECISVCWMTIILLAISFLVFYGLGISANRRQPVVVFKCNNSGPASDVFYHHIVQKGAYIPFAIFSEYLSTMAVQYPSLRFNIYFLVDDSTQNGKRPRLLKRLVPAIPGTLNVIVEQSNRREIRDFQRRYQNVNITIISISKYMATTPLRFKWKSIPPMYLPFYARVLSVWQSGGIGMDLVTFNKLYKNRQDVDYKIQAILKQHSDGIETEKYVDILNSIQRDDDNEIFSLFFNVIQHLISQTSTFFNSDISQEIKLIDDETLVRTHRNKRDTTEKPISNISTDLTKLNKNSSLTETTLTKLQSTITNITGNEANKTNTSSFNSSYETIKHPGGIMPMPVDFPQVLIFYDFLISDDVGPSYPVPPMIVNQATPMKITEFNKLNKQGKMSNHLSVSLDGTFVAAPMCYHPFLSQLLMSMGYKREIPSNAIKDTLMSQCSTFLRDDVYCDNIHIINKIF